MELLKSLQKQTSDTFPVLVFPEVDARVLEAARTLDRKKIARAVLLVRNKKEAGVLKRKKFSLKHGLVLIMEDSPQMEHYASYLVKRRKKKGMIPKMARSWLKEPNVFAYCMLKHKGADGVISGNISTTADVARRAFQVVGVEKGYRHAHGAYLILLKDRLYVCTDVAVEIRPDAAYLAETAVQSVKFLKQLKIRPKVAFLSFSTHGSAAHEEVDRIRKAAKIAKRKCPRVAIDGELQFDVATDPRVAKIKAPKSPIKGDANILVFPDLAAGNIGCKILGSYGKGRLMGPVFVGLSHPVSDLSRGCRPQDIVDTACLVGSLVKRPTPIDRVCFQHSIPHP